MEKCNCYHEEKRICGWLSPQVPVTKPVGVCWGTKEREECSCGGDQSKCNFYPEKRADANVGYQRTVDDLGRIAIPKDIRKTLELHEGDSVSITLKNNQIIIKKI